MIAGTEFDDFKNKRKKRMQHPFRKINNPQFNSLTTRVSAANKNKFNTSNEHHSQNFGEKFETSEQFTINKNYQDVHPFQTLPFAMGGNSIDMEYGRNT